MEARYRACMVLGGVGDALGYKNGKFEFCDSGRKLHKEVEALGGVANIKVELPDWRVSDDTVMHLATAEALIAHGKEDANNSLYCKVAAKYKECMYDMGGRAPGDTCMAVTEGLNPEKELGFCVDYNPRGGGCGAAMRAMCIGLRYPNPEQIDSLMAVATESGRMTHNHPIGFLGSVGTALFTAYAIQGVPIHEWGAKLLQVLPRSLNYIKDSGRHFEESRQDWNKFTSAWSSYLKRRGISDGASQPKFPEKFGVEERDAFYRSIAARPGGWPGATGLCSLIIAYDAFLGAGNSWEELASRGMFHCGDSDSTGIMAASWYGALYGIDNVPKCNYENLEYRSRLEDCAAKLYELSH